MISGVYFPVDVLPDPLVYLGKALPLYHAISIARAPLIGVSVNLFSVLYLLSFAAIMPLIGVALFNKIHKNKGIVGY